MGIYKFNNELVGIVDIVRDFPTAGQWMLELMLTEPLLNVMTLQLCN
ncbi:hypothetical protein [uncultured Clostridium sp.]|nr:hypothetical protein [uncultured Clostridium sp.]